MAGDPVWRRLRRVWSGAPARDVDAELQFHLDARASDLEAGGMSAAAARARAIAEFGDMPSVRAGLVDIDARVARRRRRSERWDVVRQDLGYGVRAMRRSPGLFAAIALTFALGVGMNAAVFSVLDRLYLAVPPGIVRPDQIRRLMWQPRAVPADGARVVTTAPRDVRSVLGYEEFRGVAATLPRGMVLAGYDTDVERMGQRGDATSVTVGHVLGDYFRVLGATPAVGRFFAPEELQISVTAAVVVLSHRLWITRFGGRSDVVGQLLVVNGRRYTVIGVSGGDFHGADNDAADLWLPMNALAAPRGGAADWYAGSAWIQTLVRTPTPAASADLLRVASAALHDANIFPGDSTAVAMLGPLVEPALPGYPDPGVTIARRLALVSLIILLIACANVANLLLARGVQRRRELAMRLALGVGRARLVGLLLLEAGLAASIGGAIAIFVALEGATVLRRLLLPNVHFVDAPVNIHVLWFTVLLAIAAGLGAALAPALRASRLDLADALRGSARDGAYQPSRLRSTLVVAQAALSVVLLVGAGLVIRSLVGVEHIPTGYDSDRLLFASVRADPDHAAWQPTLAQRLPGVAEALRRIPGVERIGLAAQEPMYGISFLGLALPGHDHLPKVAADGPFVNFVSPDYLPTVGIRVVQGEVFRPMDRYGPVTPVLVNETMARAYWPGANPIGQCVMLGAGRAGCSTVIGVVTDAHAMHTIETLPMMQMYLPRADTGRGRANVIAIRTAPERRAAVAIAVRQQLESAFEGWADVRVRPMTDYLAPELRPWHAGATLFTAAGLLALIVATIGIYSTVNYTFSQRTHEIGVRIALGASAWAVLRLVISSGVRLVIAGVLAGLVLSLAAGRLVASLLYGTSAHDPMVLAAVALVLLVVAIAACLIPAWRAFRVDPAITLRMD
ncbi:MAG TPA: FtsX-like permease family protein [Gemmatimonadales bacterium]|jgi:predicted permease|nr:FtsX-like permease family protein [Gemmatimonadales bacterium]